MTGLRLGDIPKIQGTTIRSRYLETSTGLDAMDALMGGGLPLSTICLIDDDQSRAYATVLTKYFIAEGISCKHSLIVASTNRNPRELLENFPEKITDTNYAVRGNDVNGQDSTMKIAWRYSAQPKIDSSLGAIRHGAVQYDLKETLKRDQLETCDITFFPETSSVSPSYSGLYQLIRRKLMEDQFLTSSSRSTKRVLRIIIEGIGSPLWQDSENDLKFIAHLRTVLCSSYAVAMLTVNLSGLERGRKERLYTYGDLVIHLEAAEDVYVMQKLNDHFDGYFRLLKLPAVASVAAHCPASSDLVFQLQKQKFEIRVLHLPPAFGDDFNHNREIFKTSCQGKMAAFKFSA